jgi:hypothetical protein
MNKNQLILNIFLAGGIATASAQDGSVSEADLLGIGILPSTIPVLDGSGPEDRPIASTEKNPFSERETEAPQVVLQTENEELKIKRMINDMAVHGGLMSRVGGPKILLGDLILQKGSLVPQILPDQTEQLVVQQLDGEKIELAFLETPQYKGQPRVITIPLDIRPTVGQVLSGGSDDYLVQKGRDEMDAEKQLASVLASRATGGSIGTTLPGITVNGKTAKLERGSGLSSLLRNYGQPKPNASGITSKPTPAANGSAGSLNPSGASATVPAPAPGAGTSSGQISEGSEIPFDFGGFPMSPAEEAPQGAGSATPSASSPAAPESHASAPTRNSPSSPPPPPSFTN